MTQKRVKIRADWVNEIQNMKKKRMNLKHILIIQRMMIFSQELEN